MLTSSSKWSAIIVVGFSVEDYEAQLDAALRPVIDAAKLVITRTSQVIIVVVVFVIAVHVASAVLRYYFRLAEAPRDAVAGPRNVYVTAHAPPVVVGGGSGAGMEDDGSSGTPTMRLRRPVAAEMARLGETARGGEYDSAGEDYGISPGRVDADLCGRDFDSAGEDDRDAAAAVHRRPPTSAGSMTSTSAQLTLRTARRTSATMTPQSTLDFKYSETNV